MVTIPLDFEQIKIYRYFMTILYLTTIQQLKLLHDFPWRDNKTCYKKRKLKLVFVLQARLFDQGKNIQLRP